MSSIQNSISNYLSINRKIKECDNERKLLVIEKKKEEEFIKEFLEETETENSGGIKLGNNIFYIQNVQKRLPKKKEEKIEAIMNILSSENENFKTKTFAVKLMEQQKGEFTEQKILKIISSK